MFQTRHYLICSAALVDQQETVGSATRHCIAKNCTAKNRLNQPGVCVARGMGVAARSSSALRQALIGELMKRGQFRTQIFSNYGRKERTACGAARQRRQDLSESNLPAIASVTTITATAAAPTATTTTASVAAPAAAISSTAAA